MKYTVEKIKYNLKYKFYTGLYSILFSVYSIGKNSMKQLTIPYGEKKKKIHDI